MTEVDSVTKILDLRGVPTPGDIQVGKAVIEEALMNVPVVEGTKRRLVFTYIELAQNILKYSNRNRTNADCETGIVINFDGETFEVLATNLISGRHAKRVIERIEAISKMSRDEIRDTYLRTLRTPEIDSSTGAGLGLLALGKESKKAISYNVVSFPGVKQIRQLSIKILI